MHESFTHNPPSELATKDFSDNVRLNNWVREETSLKIELGKTFEGLLLRRRKSAWRRRIKN
jgi:hypothetical protein